MTQVLDRRDQPRNNADIDRKRFLKRNRRHIKKAVEKAITEGGITNLGGGGTDVAVPVDTVAEPTIRTGDQGVRNKVFPWNKKFDVGDLIPKPPSGSGRGNKGSPDGEGEDDFMFHLTEEEFLQYIFDDLELPNLTKKNDEKSLEVRYKNAGYTSSGPYSRLSIQESFKQKTGRTIGQSKKNKKVVVGLLEEALGIYRKYTSDKLDKIYKDSDSRNKKIDKMHAKIKHLKTTGLPVTEDDANRLQEIEVEVGGLSKRHRLTTRWNEEIDLKYRDLKKENVPSSNAVMFCVMDVSASMSEYKKNNAKVFYFMLYRFLKKNYENTDVVFIRHHTTAKEVDEREFFYGRETGGTKVSTGLQVMKDVMRERYSKAGWNIYGAQASDGDNWGEDNSACRDLLIDIIEKSQAYFYTELLEDRNHAIPKSDLWDLYKEMESEYPGQFFMDKIKSRNEVLNVFRGFFKKENNRASALAPGM